ncbi:MAG: adenylate/guanylate cyclase domain-containing protein [Planctomycetaceae bacterium]
MVELIATGLEARHSRRFQLQTGIVVCLGRAPRTGWSVSWDRKISREHAELHWTGDVLTVRRLKTARNPVWVDEKPAEEFQIGIGESFQIGDTRFQLSAGPSTEEREELLTEQIYDPTDLDAYPFDDHENRLEELARLPLLIGHADSDEEFTTQIAKCLLRCIPRASAAAVIGTVSENTSLSSKTDWNRVFQDAGDDHLLSDSGLLIHCEKQQLNTQPFRPSRRLINKAMERGKIVLQVWDDKGLSESQMEFTLVGNLDWAFCVPIVGEVSHEWCLYVSGVFAASPGADDVPVSPGTLMGDLRFAALLAQYVSMFRQLRELQHQQAELSSFFSPAVMEAIRSHRAESLLAPSESEISVLFCDVRGFSKKTEEDREQLMALLQRVSNALSVMTRNIVKHEGILADFQGDAALGFWGWPTPLEDGPLWACRTALAIQNEFSSATSQKNEDANLSPVLSNFRVGIGIAHGRAVAGRIGAEEHAKVGVFGPVVNLGSRLEGLTKIFRVPILIDEETAMLVRRSQSELDGRCRKLACVIPYGTKHPINIYELLPPAGPNQPITDEHILIHERAVEKFIAGRWQEALDDMDLLPVRDRAKDFLMIFIAQHHYEPPDDWDGVIRMQEK